MSTPVFQAPRVLANLRLDKVDSTGNVVLPLDPSSARPSALSFSDGMIWFGFVINDSDIKTLQPGEEVTCWVSLFNHEGALESFPRGASLLFGDGVATRGVVKIFSLETSPDRLP